MIRIVHLSDLHLLKPGAFVAPEQERSSWDAVKAHFLEEFKLEIKVNGHDQFRLQALDIVLSELKPSLIVVTGDITTYGDRESFEFALEKLKEWQQKYGNVLCVPGNHDALQERFNELRQRSGSDRIKVEKMASLLKSFENVFQGVPKPGLSVVPMPFLDSYETIIAKNLECPPDPGAPVWVETPWGWLCFFLFNSVNDPGSIRLSLVSFNPAQPKPCLGSASINRDGRVGGVRVISTWF